MQRKMKHHIKTGSGVSEGFIMFSPVIKTLILSGIVMMLCGPIGGVGQGGGGSPIIWLAVLLILIQAYKKQNDGIGIINPIDGIRIMYWIISYVDDNTVVREFKNKSKPNEMLQMLKENLLFWNSLLKFMGGALSLNKCKVSLMHWRQDFFGILRMSTNKDNTTIQIPSEEGGDNMDNLEQLEPWECKRILGVRIPMDGKMTQEFKYRVKQIDDMAKRATGAPFTPKDMELVYQVRYKPTIKYALPVTLFNGKQLQRIQQKFINSYLPKVCMNRHFPRALVFGPTTLGGVGIMDLKVEQPLQAIKSMTGHLRRNNNAGKMIRATLYFTQIKVGISTPFIKMILVDSCIAQVILDGTMCGNTPMK